MRILLIEPDIFLGKKLKELLEKNRCTVDLILDERELLCCRMFSSFQLIIFEISSTKAMTEALTILSHLRRNHVTLPILYLCSTDTAEERILALDKGADDCLPKSFSPSEFLARVRALGRRSNTYSPELLTLENTTLDCNQYLLSASENQIQLSNKELTKRNRFSGGDPHHPWSRLFCKMLSLTSRKTASCSITPVKTKSRK